jgi:cyclopropane-fatty-acyl-phospholipid synthase
MRDPYLRLGEAYVDGKLIVEKGSIYDFLQAVLKNIQDRVPPWWVLVGLSLRYLTRRIQQYNPVGKARRNVAHHYDLDGRLYELFLDADRQYSCAYFKDSDDLEEAQLAKKRHIAAKLDVRDGQKLLDIGSGWGGMALYLAKIARVSVTGVTLSSEQHTMSNARAKNEGLGKCVDFKLQDYRELDGPFDRIVSVGMFEHVGVGHYSEFFGKVRQLLANDGVMLLHSIGRFDGPGVTSPWIAKYIFPGGYIPALSEVMPKIEAAGLRVTDVEILRLHYAETLRHWRQRFVANWDKAAEIYDERFCRMWEYYLAASETAFRYQDMMVFQIQIVRRQETLPLTRDYMYERERALEAAESGVRHRLAGE